MVDVFISYKREERARVEEIDRALRALGLDVWFDARLTAGSAFTDEITDTLSRCKAVLVCWSQGAVNSQFVRAEALKAQNKLVACMVESADLPVPFNEMHAADLTYWSGEGDDSAWQSVLSRLGRLVGRPGIGEFARISAALARDYDPEAHRALKRWLAEHPRDPLVEQAQALEIRNREIEAGYLTARRHHEKEETDRRRSAAEARAARDAEAQHAAEQARVDRLARSRTRTRATSQQSWLNIRTIPPFILVGILLVAGLFYLQAGSQVGDDGEVIPRFLAEPTLVSELDPRVGAEVNVSFTPTGTQAFGVTYKDFRMVRWNVLTGEAISEVVPIDATGSRSPDGAYEVRYGQSGYEVWSIERQIKLRDAPFVTMDGRQCRAGYGSASMPPQTRLLVVSSNGWFDLEGAACTPGDDALNEIITWVFDLDNSTALASAPAYVSNYERIAQFSRDGTIGAFTNDDGGAVFWTVRDGRVLSRFPPNTLTPNGSALIRADGAEAFASIGEQFVLLDINSGRARYALQDLPPELRYEDRAYVGDDPRVLMRQNPTSNAFSLYSVRSGEVLAEIDAGGSIYASGSEDESGRIRARLTALGRVITYGDQKPLRIWAVESGRQIAALPLNADIFDLTISPDGLFFAVNEAREPLHRLRVFRTP